MAVALHVYIQDKGAAEDAPISVEHVFYGNDEADADRKRLAHLGGCENYAKADVDGRTAEFVETISDVEVPIWADVSADDDEGEEDGGVIDVEGTDVDPEEEP